MTMSFGPGKRRRQRVAPPDSPPKTTGGELKPAFFKSTDTYRSRSLKIHGWICAKCAREFEEHNLHLLTVHHKDGNPANNPPDGSNWENLCAYCHEDEHSRGVLGEYLQGKK